MQFDEKSTPRQLAINGIRKKFDSWIEKQGLERCDKKIENPSSPYPRVLY
jgi:hypothetical protein